MKFELSENDAKNLLRMVEMSESIMGYMDDYIDDPKLATRSRKWSAVKQLLFKAAHEQKCTDLIEHDECGYAVNETEFDTNMEIQDQFEDLILHKNLANKLAWRDFHEHYTSGEIEKMTKDENTYLGVELHSFEERYWKEFQQYEYSRLRIDDSPKT